MKKRYNFLFLLTGMWLLLLSSCQKERYGDPDPDPSQGVPLRIGVNFGVETRLSELPGTEAMVDSVINNINYGLNNIGLYVYYTSDYDANILSKPYIRNMECTVVNGELVPVLGPDEDPDSELIYIYDRMTVVAYYPYNPEMSLPENYFNTTADEAKYPITREDYSQQYYIPYRASTTTNPTTAFYTTLTFYPKHVYKVEIVVVSDDFGALPTTADELQILPGIDPVTETAGYRRAEWYDGVTLDPDQGGGSNIGVYTALIWTLSDHRNDLEKGEVLLQSGKLTLIASQRVPVTESYIYRYGYNMSTGEVFIPTSSNYIHDIPTLKSVDGVETNAYQVCDIDFTGQADWTPITLFNGRYDGGGHAIRSLSVNTNDTEAGLFSHVKGNATLCNVNLIDPVITVNAADTVYAGALCGRMNSPLTEAERRRLIGNLPENLSDVVRDVLIQEMLSKLANSQSSIVACRVDNPTITVTGPVPYVGSVVGAMGARDNSGTFKARIWDTYSLDGSISVNAANPAANEGGAVGGFVGLNNGYITRSYTTISSIDFDVPVQVDPLPAPPTPTPSYEGFTNQGTLFSSAEGAGLDSDFAVLADSNTGGVQLFSTAWPPGSWVMYTDWWPINATGWLSGYSGNSFWYNVGSAPATYPILQWQRR